MNLTHRFRSAGPTSRSHASGPAAALVAVLLIAGCGTSEEKTASEPTTASAESEPTQESATESAEQSATGSESESTQESATESVEASATESETGAAAEDLVITIAEFAFEVPESIPAGSEITVINEDAVGHTVTSDEEGVFDVLVGPGEEVSFTVPDEAGEFAFHCTPHPNMVSTLVVG